METMEAVTIEEAVLGAEPQAPHRRTKKHRTRPVRSTEVPRDFRQALRVKIKSLAEEARIIRHEERRSRHEWTYVRLHQHRVIEVREAARHAHIAYALIRGREYTTPKTNLHGRADSIDWKAVAALVRRFGKAGDHTFTAIPEPARTTLMLGAGLVKTTVVLVEPEKVQ